MIALWFVVFLTSCGTSGIIVRESTKTLSHRLPQSSSVFIFTKEEPNLSDSLLIGTIATRNNGFKGDCNFIQVKRAAKKKAKEMGGNLIYITKHSPPKTLLHPCHRIRGNIYSVPNPEAFEKEILWSPHRKLKVSDFKGSTKDRPYVAATNAYFGYNTIIKSEENLVVIEVDTYFNCNLSYFKDNENQSLVLHHEQLHFDITELYARKFTQRLHREVTNFKDLVKKVEQIGDEVDKELQLKQGAYDTDVHNDLSQQSHWDEWTKKGLKELDRYKHKTIGRPYGTD